MNRVYYLRAADAAILDAALLAAGLLVEGIDLAGAPIITLAPGLTLQVVGTVSEPTGETIERDGMSIPVMRELPGWHAVLLADLTDAQRQTLASVLIDKPDYPLPTFAGVEDVQQLEPAQPSIDQLRTAAIDGINAGYTAATRQLSAGYPDAERESWPVQIAEARRLLADGSADTPWIDAAAAERGIDRADLAQRIQLLDGAYRAIHGRLSGIRQRLERAALDVDAAAADAREQLQAIAWPAPVGEGT